MPIRITLTETKPNPYVDWWVWSPEELAKLKTGPDHTHEHRTFWERKVSDDGLTRVTISEWTSREEAEKQRDAMVELEQRRVEYNQDVGITMEKTVEEI
jgi:hypothetical protein